MTLQERAPEVMATERSEMMAQLPLAFMRWQSESRLELARRLEEDGAAAVRDMPSHLPVMATKGSDGRINLAQKGMGLLPTKGRMQEFTTLFRRTVEECSRHEWGSTLAKRAKALSSLYSDLDNLDPKILGGLEIFEGTTYRNLRREPSASLLFTGEAPDFRSYQVDGVVELVGEEDPLYRFLLAARELFARDRFHVLQARYPWAMVVRVRSVRDKRPFSRR